MTFAQETSIHGIRDLLTSKSKWEMALWCTLIAAAMLGLAFQLSSVIEAYLEDAAVTTVESYYPEKLPAAMFCPSFRTIKPEAQTGITDNVDLFIEGYSLAFRSQKPFINWLRTGKGNPAAVQGTVDEAMTILRSTNYSLSAYYAKYAYSFDDLLQANGEYHSTQIETGSIVTLFGLCYYAQHTAKMYAKASKLIFMKITLKFPQTQKATDPLSYQAFFGYRPDFEVVPATSGIPVIAGQDAVVDVQTVKKLRYPGRRSNRCRDYERSDNARCILLTGYSLSNCTCKPVFQRTPAHPEGLVDKNSCNMFGSLCVTPPSEEKMARVMRKCPEPCVEYDHQPSVATVFMPCWNETNVTVRLGGSGYAIQVRESEAVSLAELMGTIGGTIGLYFGMSVLSVAQVGVFVARMMAHNPPYNLR